MKTTHYLSGKSPKVIIVPKKSSILYFSLIKYFNKHLFFCINTNFFVALAVLCLHLSSQILLNSSNSNISIFIFFATILTYNFQRIIIIKNGIDNKKRLWIKKNKKTIYL